MERVFTLEYWQDEGWYVGRLKEVPGVFSQGESLVELEENICEAYKRQINKRYGVKSLHFVSQLTWGHK